MTATLGGAQPLGDTWVPELAAEVASSTESYDLHSKKRDYERAGVREYLVVALRQRKVFCFKNQDGTFRESPPDSDGIHRSSVFSGLWLDPAALLSLQSQRVMELLRQGIATPGHDEYMTRLSR
jgi:Uma2 family endonuclease